MTPPNPSLTVTAVNNLIVQFDKPMNFRSVTSTSISVDVSLSTGQVNAVNWSNPTFSESKSMMVNLTFESSYLPVESNITLNFVDVQNFIDEDNVTISVLSLKGNLHSFGTPLSNSTSLLTTSMAQETKAGVAGGVSAAATVSVLNMSPQSLISLVNQLQLMSYIGLTNVSLPQDFASTLAALNMGSLFSNPFSGNIATNETTQLPPEYMQSYGIGSALFLPNTLPFLGTSAAVLLAYLPIYLLSKVKNKRISQYFGAMMPSLMWGVPLQLWLTSYLDIGVYSFLQLMYIRGSTSNIYTLGNVIAAFLFSMLVIATPLAIVTFTYNNYSVLLSREDESFNKRWGVLFMGFRANGQYTSVVYYSYFFVRRFLLAATLIFFQSSPDAILLVNVSTALTAFLYVLTYRPIEGRLNHFAAAVNEGSTSFIYLLVCVFLLDIDPAVGATIGQIGVWITRLAVFVNVLVSLCQTVIMVSQVVKEFQRLQQVNRAWANVRAVTRFENAEKQN